VNASLLFLGTALAVGGDPAIVVGVGCNGCGAPAVTYAASAPAVCHPMPSCDPCERAGLLARLRARLASWRKPKAVCAPACVPASPACPTNPCCTPAPSPAPVCGTPVFTGFTTSCADPCHKSGLLDRLRAKFRGARGCDACAAPLPCGSLDNWSGGSAPAAGCASTVGTVAPASAPTSAPPTTAAPASPPTEPKKQ
jgi:hypothetical protein